MRSRQLYASITATTTGTVYFDIPDNTTIRAVQWAICVTPAANADSLLAEISMSAQNQTAVSDAQGVISGAGCAYTITTSGAVLGALNYTTPVNVPVKAGTRIYLNATEAGTGTWSTRAIVWFD